MSNSYSQIYIHFVFAVQNRLSLIHSKWKSNLFKYISGIIKNNGHKLFIINGVSDHIHILVGLNPKQSISSLVSLIKSNSSKWVNDEKFVVGKFNWQEGYGAFSYSKSHLPNVIRYIENQEIHHLKRTFNEEYLKILGDFDIDFDVKYVLKSPEI
jgi:REP element-mobilizing transposase RayT